MMSECFIQTAKSGEYCDSEMHVRRKGMDGASAQPTATIVTTTEPPPSRIDPIRHSGVSQDNTTQNRHIPLHCTVETVTALPPPLRRCGGTWLGEDAGFSLKSGTSVELRPVLPEKGGQSTVLRCRPSPRCATDCVLTVQHRAPI